MSGNSDQPTKVDPLEAAYSAGWANSARWAHREDLLSDEWSMAYVGERDEALAAIRKESAEPNLVTALLDRIEAYPFSCPAGDLRNSADWQKLRSFIEQPETPPAPATPREFWIDERMVAWRQYREGDIHVREVLDTAPEPPTSNTDPCPTCEPGTVCRTPSCGRLKLCMQPPTEKGS